VAAAAAGCDVKFSTFCRRHGSHRVDRWAYISQFSQLNQSNMAVFDTALTVVAGSLDGCHDIIDQQPTEATTTTTTPIIRLRQRLRWNAKNARRP